MVAAQKKHWLGIAGTFFGCLAIIAAVLPIWVLPLVVPPEPVDKVVVDTAQKIKDRIVAKAKGIEYKEPQRHANAYQVLAAAAVTLGAVALILGAVSFVAHEPWRFSAAASALGAGAVLFQFSLMVASAIIVVLFIAVVLNALGVSL